MIERYFAAADYSPAHFWQLCEWCRVRGADEFTFTTIGTAAVGDPAYAAMESPLLPFARPGEVREHMSAVTAEEFQREAPLWNLTPESLALLPRLFPSGPFKYSFGDDAWCEDLILYRESEVMLGTISHEDVGLLRLTDLDAVQLQAAGFPNRLTWPRY